MATQISEEKSVLVGSIAKAKGLPKAQIESALKLQPSNVQVRALKNWVKQNRDATPWAPAAKSRRQPRP